MNDYYYATPSHQEQEALSIRSVSAWKSKSRFQDSASFLLSMISEFDRKIQVENSHNQLSAFLKNSGELITFLTEALHNGVHSFNPKFQVFKISSSRAFDAASLRACWLHDSTANITRSFGNMLEAECRWQNPLEKYHRQIGKRF